MLAAISLINSSRPVSNIVRAVGTPVKRDEPVLVQDTPWEPRLDNGYPNIARTPDGAWQLFYGTCQHNCGTQLLLFANSTDGLTWHKPALGLFDVGRVRPDLAHVGRKNNIVLEGGGIGVLRDELDSDPAKRYKAFGPGCYTSGAANKGCDMALRDAFAADAAGRSASPEYPVQDLAFSSDGLQWSDARSISWPSPQRYDCHNNLAFDARDQRWVATTRDGFSAAPGRAIGLALSPSRALEFNTSVAPTLSLAGDMDRQLYSQITFPWLNIWLGIVMVYHPNEPAQRVHCRLAWAPTPDATWQWVDPLGLADDAHDFIPLGTDGSFDSHICFAARPLRVPADDAAASARAALERIYYMGGNGPHNGARNSSLGLATLRADGFASLTSGTAAPGSAYTVPINCTARTLVVTIDVQPGGSVQIGGAPGGAHVPEALAAAHAVPLTATATAAPVRFEHAADWSAIIGTEVALEIRLIKASLYAVGWADDTPPPPHAADASSHTHHATAASPTTRPAAASATARERATSAPSPSPSCGAFYTCTVVGDGAYGCAPLWNVTHPVCCSSGQSLAHCPLRACNEGAPPDWPPLNDGCVGLGGAAPPPPPPLPSSVVFAPGLANVTCYRIPSVVQLSSGALVAFAEARRGSCSDGAAREIATRTSHDGGATWGAVGFALGGEGGGVYAAGNPVATVLADGTTIVLMVALHSASCVGNCVVGNAVTVSTDGAQSWSAPVNVTASLGAEGKARTGPGVGLLLPLDNGRSRLLVPGSTGTYGADHVYISDDRGASWRVARNDTALSSHQLDEAQITALPNGSSLILMRHPDEGWKGKAASLSDDGGETWGAVSYVPPLEGPVCQSSIVSFGGATFFSGPDSNSHQRVRMTVKRSDDSAASFPKKLLIDGGDGAYSCLVPGALLARYGADGGARHGASAEGGLLYEAAGGALRFVRFPLDLEGGSLEAA